MSNLYDLYLPNLIRTTNNTSAIVGVPPITDYSASSMVYNDILLDWDNGEIKNIQLQFLSNLANNNIDLAFANSSLKQLQTTSINELSKQYSRENIYLDTFKVQTFNSKQQQYISNQYSKYYILFGTVELQKVKITNKKISNQYNLDYFQTGNLQRVKFSNVDKNKIIWMMRAVNADTQNYKYWNSQNVNKELNTFNEVPNSREVLGSYFLTGSKINNIHGLLFISNPPLDAYTGSTSDSGSDNLPELQYYIQKNNIVDNREIIKLWVNRGTLTDNKHYEYWKDSKLSSQSTTYNVLEESKETLNSIYKKQE